VEGKDVSYRGRTVPHTSIPWQVTLMVHPLSACITVDVHAFVNSVDIVEEFVVVEHIHGGLVVQKYPCPWDLELLFFNL
jgi:hypothetical protein